MDVNDGPIPSSSGENSDISLENQPPPPMHDSVCNGPPTKPARSADIPPDPAPRPPERQRPYYTGLSLERAQEQAIQRWELPRRPEYGTLDVHVPSTKTRDGGMQKESFRWDL